MPSGPDLDSTRTALLDAAARLFVERGYHGVGLESVGKEAHVSRQTVYNQFGSKGGLLRAVTAHVEDRAGLPMHLGKVFSQTDGLSMLRSMLDTIVAVEPLVRPLSRVIHAARIEDETARELWHNRMNSRLMGITMVMNRLNAEGRLRAGLTVEEAAEIGWSIASPHHFEFLVIDRQWSLEHFRAHLEQVITAATMRPRGTRRPTTPS